MPQPTQELSATDLEDLATGAWILGTGGGGDPYFSLLEAKLHLAAGKRVRLVDPLGLPDDALIGCVGQMGAPLAMQERMCDGAVMARTVTMMQAHLGRKFDALMLWEIGGNNAFQSILAGQLLDLPIVDCDAMGRAFPQADMTSFAICDLPAAPWTMVDIRANSMIFTEAVDWAWMERMTRRMCVLLGSSAATCKAPRTGAEVKRASCLHTASRALRIGRTVRASRAVHADPVAAVVQGEGGMVLFRGKITDVMRRATEGWLRGTVAIDGLDDDAGATMRIDFQNEWSVAWKNDEVAATVPDLVVVLDSVSGEAIGTETVRFGQRVTVIALPAPPLLTTPKGLAHVGPRAFGYDLDFVPVFPAMIRIGIDVGGTNTDAVALDGGRVLHATKTATTADVTGGILAALRAVLAGAGLAAGRIGAVMIGTTHFTNAVVQRRDLARIGAIRIGLPAAASLPPFIDWPADLRDVVEGPVAMLRGGHEVDGRELVPFDHAAMRAAARRMAEAGVPAVAVCAVFSPLDASGEAAAAAILAEVAPGIAVTQSHELGRIGLLARENVGLLNAALAPLAARTVAGFRAALAASGITAPLFITQNDGTVASADEAAAFPVRSFASGPTNSLRGAAFLSGLGDAMVVDVGGTTTDVGSLVHGFPREANNVVEVGGVRTLFRMPDLVSVGLGGGTLVDSADPSRIGPLSVGYRLGERALVFGGPDLTCTDIAVAAGLVELGDPARLARLDRGFVAAALARIHAIIADAVDRMRADATPRPLVAVGGGAFLVPDTMPGVSHVVRVANQGVANALGAAIAQVSGEVDQVFQGMTRDDALARAKEIASERAVRAGADPQSIAVVDQEDIPVAYLPGNSLRVRVRVVGDVAGK